MSKGLADLFAAKVGSGHSRLGAINCDHSDAETRDEDRCGRRELGRRVSIRWLSHGREGDGCADVWVSWWLVCWR